MTSCRKSTDTPVRTAEEFLTEVAKAESDPLRVQFVRNQQTMELDVS